MHLRCYCQPLEATQLLLPVYLLLVYPPRVVIEEDAPAKDFVLLGHLATLLSYFISGLALRHCCQTRSFVHDHQYRLERDGSVW